MKDSEKRGLETNIINYLSVVENRNKKRMMNFIKTSTRVMNKNSVKFGRSQILSISLFLTGFHNEMGVTKVTDDL